eukprot:7279874-Prymnesium_polylepis.1
MHMLSILHRGAVGPHAGTHIEHTYKHQHRGEPSRIPPTPMKMVVDMDRRCPGTAARLTN